MLIASTQVVPRGAAYPDSDKIRIRWGTGDEDALQSRRAAAVDYWDGE